MGIFAGASGSRKVMGEIDSWGLVLSRATLTGFIHGIMLASLVCLAGSLNAAGIKMSAYLPQLLPDAILQLLYGRSPIQAALIHLIFMTVMGLLGGLLVVVLDGLLAHGLCNALGWIFVRVQATPDYTKRS